MMIYSSDWALKYQFDLFLQNLLDDESYMAFQVSWLKNFKLKIASFFSINADPNTGQDHAMHDVPKTICLQDLMVYSPNILLQERSPA